MSASTDIHASYILQLSLFRFQKYFTKGYLITYIVKASDELFSLYQ